MNSRQARVRLLLSALLLTAAMGGLGIRLAFLHLGRNEAARARIQEQRSYEREILAGRGAIHDCNGPANVLAMNLTMKDVCADPATVVSASNLLQTASVLATRLELPIDEVAVKLNRPDRRFAYVRRFVEEDRASAIAGLGLDGVFFRETEVRHYPQRAFMCHLLGFVNREGVGSAGVEQAMDRFLRGSPGIVEGRLNALRQDVYVQRGRTIPALEGADITLTVDQNIQHMLEKALDEAMAEHAAHGAWAAVQRIHTGEILAMASRPAYDLNAYERSSEVQRLNRAIGYVYEPGSTFKPMVIAAALDRGIVTPDTMFDCENGSWVYQRRVLRDYHPYDRLSVADGLKKSSNILTAKVALMMGDKTLYQALRAFGFGAPTGIDLPGEERGILHPVSAWSGISATRISIGQGVAVTAVQLLNAICAIANDGFLMRPYVIREVRSPAGACLYRAEPEVCARPLSVETAALMRELMGRVTEDGGTGRRARVPGYRVAGKTGTAQKPVGGGYSDTDYMASFVGFLPVQAPEIGVIVVVDTPQPYHTGGTVAAPVFSRIAGEAVRYLNVPGDDVLVVQANEAHR